MCDGCEIPSATPTMRRAAVQAVGGYARWLHHTCDYHLYLKLARAGWRFDYVDRPLATYTGATPERGASYDHLGVRLEEVRLWIGFALRHPLTPGPRRQVRRRVPR